MMAGYICPMESVPFGSTLYLTTVLVALGWLLCCTAALVPMALPSEPCRRLLSVIFPALMPTLRMMDACTDLSFLRVLAVQVCTFDWSVVGLCADVLLTGNAPEYSDEQTSLTKYQECTVLASANCSMFAACMQKSEGCFYCGVPGHCGTLTGMQAAIGSFAGLDVLANTTYIIVQHSWQDDSRKGRSVRPDQVPGSSWAAL